MNPLLLNSLCIAMLLVVMVALATIIYDRYKTGKQEGIGGDIEYVIKNFAVLLFLEFIIMNLLGYRIYTLCLLL